MTSLGSLPDPLSLAVLGTPLTPGMPPFVALSIIVVAAHLLVRLHPPARLMGRQSCKKMRMVGSGGEEPTLLGLHLGPQLTPKDSLELWGSSELSQMWQGGLAGLSPHQVTLARRAALGEAARVRHKV